MDIHWADDSQIESYSAFFFMHSSLFIFPGDFFAEWRTSSLFHLQCFHGCEVWWFHRHLGWSSFRRRCVQRLQALASRWFQFHSSWKKVTDPLSCWVLGPPGIQYFSQWQITSAIVLFSTLHRQSRLFVAESWAHWAGVAQTAPWRWPFTNQLASPNPHSTMDKGWPPEFLGHVGKTSRTLFGFSECLSSVLAIKISWLDIVDMKKSIYTLWWYHVNYAIYTSIILWCAMRCTYEKTDLWKLRVSVRSVVVSVGGSQEEVPMDPQRGPLVMQMDGTTTHLQTVRNITGGGQVWR